ncbi:hypothetical protein [Cellulomonas endometrii]|uniref:hypothetical protein n=1 Tax=Cellulomonas endometrii TaxID=3036301 RepID=UPI0024AD17E3|nr:hypothetical protein [Cellulomonas endometrii]
MPIDEVTQAAVHALWEAGARHGRPPAPVPEADPWDAADVDGSADALDSARGRVSVLFDGAPALAVHLHRDGRDTVRVEDVVDLEVPRRDVVAVVDALLAGRARRRATVRGLWGNLLGVLLSNPAPSDLVVRVGGDDGTAPREYTGPVLLAVPLSGWLMSLRAPD